MAAFETPWLSMSAPRSSYLRPDSSDPHGYSNPASPGLSGDRDGSGNGNGGGNGGGGSGSGSGGYDSYYSSSNPKPTYATFSPANSLSGKNNNSSSAAAKRRSTILVHQKSPLLLATPPQITRALAYSHPYLLPLNKLAGLITWTTGDPWESFILVLLWWLTVLYGDTIIRLAGPILMVLTLIGGMYGRRYSPLSTSGWSSEDGIVGGGTSSGSSNSRSSGSTTSGGGLGYFLFGIGGSNNTSREAKTTGRDTTTAKHRSRAKNQSLDSVGASYMTSGKGRGAGNGSIDASSGAGGGGGNGHQRTTSEAVASARHQKTLDEIVDTLGEFTARCNLLLEPLLELTDFLSTQSTATSATTRPALTVLFVRILLCTPFWFLLTLPPMHIVTTRRVALVFGTLILTWHSRVMRVSRTILWRSASIRRVAALVTGLEFEGPMRPSKAPSYVTAGGSILSDPSTAAAALQSKLSSTKSARRLSTPRESELTKAIRRARAGQDAGVRFTFILYENQRRWVGLGWTTSLFAYERPAWTDEHNNAVPSKDEFELPEVEDGSKMRWRWVEDGRWRVDGVVDDAVRVEKTGAHGEHKDSWDYDGEGGRMGWVYYDNKWHGGRRGQDGWTRWTRRRKWYRDAELVEVDLDDEATSTASQTDETVAGSTATLGAAQPPSAQRSASPAPSHTGTAATTSTAVTSGSEGTNAATTASTNGAADSKPTGGSASINSGGDASAAATDSIDGGDGAETASIISTSSKSTRFRPPGLRRRATDTSSRGVAAPAVTTVATATAIPSNGTRRSSEAEEEADMLSSSLGVKPSGGGGGSSWGYGDEALMGLD